MKRKAKVILLLIVLFFAFSPGEKLYANKAPKDPFLAGVLSWTWSGLGHFYTKDYTTGSMFLSLNLLQTGGLVFIVFNYSARYTNDKQGDNVVEWKELSSFDQGVVIGFVLTSIFIKGWAVYDSVVSAQRYNAAHFARKQASVLPGRVRFSYKSRDLRDQYEQPARQHQIGLGYRF